MSQTVGFYENRVRTHEVTGPVLHDGPALLGLDDDGHDPGIMLVMEVLWDFILPVHRHVWVCILQVIVHLVQPPWKTDDKAMVENIRLSGEITIMLILMYDLRKYQRKT